MLINNLLRACFLNKQLLQIEAKCLYWSSILQIPLWLLLFLLLSSQYIPHTHRHTLLTVVYIYSVFLEQCGVTPGTICFPEKATRWIYLIIAKYVCNLIINIIYIPFLINITNSRIHLFRLLYINRLSRFIKLY